MDTRPPLLFRIRRYFKEHPLGAWLSTAAFAISTSVIANFVYDAMNMKPPKSTEVSHSIPTPAISASAALTNDCEIVANHDFTVLSAKDERWLLVADGGTQRGWETARAEGVTLARSVAGDHEDFTRIELPLDATKWPGATMYLQAEIKYRGVTTATGAEPYLGAVANFRADRHRVPGRKPTTYPDDSRMIVEIGDKDQWHVITSKPWPIPSNEALKKLVVRIGLHGAAGEMSIRKVRVEKCPR